MSGTHKSKAGWTALGVWGPFTTCTSLRAVVAAETGAPTAAFPLTSNRLAKAAGQLEAPAIEASPVYPSMGTSCPTNRFHPVILPGATRNFCLNIIASAVYSSRLTTCDGLGSSKPLTGLDLYLDVILWPDCKNLISRSDCILALSYKTGLYLKHFFAHCAYADKRLVSEHYSQPRIFVAGYLIHCSVTLACKAVSRLLARVLMQSRALRSDNDLKNFQQFECLAANS